MLFPLRRFPTFVSTFPFSTFSLSAFNTKPDFDKVLIDSATAVSPVKIEADNIWRTGLRCFVEKCLLYKIHITGAESEDLNWAAYPWIGRGLHGMAHIAFLSPPSYTESINAWECCQQCVIRRKIPRRDTWITLGTLFEEPLYLWKGHLAILVVTPVVAVPLCILHEIVDSIQFFHGRLVRLYTNGGQLQIAQPKVAYCMNEVIFVVPPGPQALLQKGETHTAVRHG